MRDGHAGWSDSGAAGARGRLRVGGPGETVVEPSRGLRLGEDMGLDNSLVDLQR